MTLVWLNVALGLIKPEDGVTFQVDTEVEMLLERANLLK